VFAVWVSQPDVNVVFLRKLNAALHYGVSHIPEVVKHFQSQFHGNFDLETYLTKSIDYNFDELKRKSLEKFLGFVAQGFQKI
jgi:predicted solute-binding protein